MAKTNAERQKDFKERQAVRMRELEQKVAELEGVIAAISCLLANRNERNGKKQIEEAFKISNDAVGGMDWTPGADIFDEDEAEAKRGEARARC